MTVLQRVIPDRFLAGLVLMVVAASLFPANVTVRPILDNVVTIAIMVLFFFHGLRLSRASVLAGFGHWRLHLAILGVTFLLYPLAALALAKLLAPLMVPELWVGILFLACVPSTVQSSISLISIARGNVAAGVAQAAASNMLGVVLTPITAGLLLSVQGHDLGLSGIGKIASQLLLPFAVGHALRPLLLRWVEPYLKTVSTIDRGTILLVVYSAFSAAAAAGIWGKLSVASLAAMLLACALLLSFGLTVTALIGRRFDREDAEAIRYAGTLKSLATGLPMAKILLTAPQAGLVIVPLMLFHQMQLFVCGWLAGRATKKSD
ncbi:MAG: bile acid:sodium symporter [Sphingomonadaceae bacterium]|nr:bile acid:sodium symporter [Sphingomonadaceae bacterium]